MNIGVFSLEGSSQAWSVWQNNLKKALSKCNIFGSEQVAMNISVYADKIETDILPYYCNWIPNAGNTKFDLKKNKFVEGFTPHHEIGIVHLAGGLYVGEEDMRLNKNLKLKIHTTSNSFIDKSFRFKKN